MINILQNFFRSIVGNIKSILLSAFIAILIWFAISLQIFPDVAKHINDIPVQIDISEYMQDKNLHLAENYNLTVSVQIQGKRYNIDKLTSTDFEAYLDFSDVSGDGVKEVPISVRAKDDSRCEIISETRTATVDVLQIASKTLDIQVKADDVQAIDDFEIDTQNLISNPSTITITGEKKLIDSISRVEVNASYDGQLASTMELRGGLSFYNNNNAIIENPDLETDNNSFTVTVPVHKVKALPLYFDIINYPPNFDINYLMEKIVIQPSKLTISSPDNSIDSLSRLNIGSMSLSDLTYQFINSQNLYTVAQFLVDGYRDLLGQSSCSLNFVDIEDYTSLQFTIPSNNFYISNQPSNINAQFITQEVTVNVVGPSGYVQALSVDDISLTINLGGSEITEGSKALNATGKINGENVRAWIAETPQIYISFTTN